MVKKAYVVTSDTSPQLPGLVQTGNLAQSMLSEYGFEVTMHNDPAMEDCLKKYKELRDACDVDERSCFCFFYAGHTAYRDDFAQHLVFRNVGRKDYLDKNTRLLGGLKCHVVHILDTCHSGQIPILAADTLNIDPATQAQISPDGAPFNEGGSDRRIPELLAAASATSSAWYQYNGEV
ncbi:hypothetical protein HK104_002486 [Borealophlyctis nickersoniae]|nr:hypothetical protein HK104_002486 [Borealophlyctis nickersoniae]